MEEGRVKKSSHCAWQIHYHIVFPVKYRKALLDEDVERIIVETARGIEERYDIEFEQIGCDRDHIHILCSAHPKVAPGQIVRVFKSLTAREIFRGKPSTLEYYFFRIAGFVGWVRRVYAVTQHDQADDIQDCWVTR